MRALGATVGAITMAALATVPTAAPALATVPTAAPAIATVPTAAPALATVPTAAPALATVPRAAAPALATVPTAAPALATVPRAAAPALATVPRAAATAAIPPPVLATARLEGSFELAGRVTAAKNVRGERTGQTVQRLWTFTSTCPSDQCPTVALVRQRVQASDALILTRRGAGGYSGNGSFFAPLRCAGRVYPEGESVPFTITVQITGAAVAGAAATATRVTATYVNRRRINHTRCVAVLGHDAVRYHGYAILSAPASARVPAPASAGVPAPASAGVSASASARARSTGPR